MLMAARTSPRRAQSAVRRTQGGALDACANRSRFEEREHFPFELEPPRIALRERRSIESVEQTDEHSSRNRHRFPPSGLLSPLRPTDARGCAKSWKSTPASYREIPPWCEQHPRPQHPHDPSPQRQPPPHGFAGGGRVGLAMVDADEPFGCDVGVRAAGEVGGKAGPAPFPRTAASSPAIGSGGGGSQAARRRRSGKARRTKPMSAPCDAFVITPRGDAS